MLFRSKHGLLSFSQVSIRGKRIFRVRPEQGIGLCRHTVGKEGTVVLGTAAAVSPPVITRDHVVYGGLDGKLYVVPLEGGRQFSFSTAFDAPITAPVAVADGRVFVGCEDGYLYILGPDGKAALPTRNLNISKIRSPLTGPLAGEKFN